MTYWLSSPIESAYIRVAENSLAQLDFEPDYLIIGSGYGAAMAALAILEDASESEPPCVVVLERGDEYVPGDFPKTLDDMPSYINYLGGLTDGPRAGNVQNPNGLWEIRQGQGITVVTGHGLGGTSLVNASVASRPDPRVLANWPEPTSDQGAWEKRFESVYQKIEQLLSVSEFAGSENFSKFKALEKTVKGLGQKTESAPLSLHHSGTSDYCAEHDPCNNCGNCVIGCHSGAKQSLNLNAWPIARQLGATLFTGARINTIEAIADKEADYPWKIHGELTRAGEKKFQLRAKNVIFAAGTLGSTEILVQSRKQHGLSLSDQLGQRFSANGDALLSSVGGRHPVNSIADVPGKKIDETSAPGPTILARATVPLGNSEAHYRGTKDGFRPFITLEDGVVPFPLVALWQELGTTQSMLRRYVDSKLSAWHTSNPQHDPLAISSDLARHGQVLLAMGIDGAYGELRLGDNDRLMPYWPDPRETQQDSHAYFESLNALFANNEHRCFDGGQYFAAPTWEPIPSKFGNQVQGVSNVGKHLLTVHPLGGCSMGIDAKSGVTDTRGRVFSGQDDTSVHEGLFVMDGATIPGAVGTNPFMAISALAYVLARENFVREKSIPAEFPKLTEEKFRNYPEGSLNHLPSEDEQKVEAVFSERLFYCFDKDQRSKMPWSVWDGPSLQEINKFLVGNSKHVTALPEKTSTLVLDIKFFLEGEHSLNNWAENPGMKLFARGELRYDDKGSILRIPDHHLLPLATLEGEVVLGKLHRAGWLQSIWRFLSVLIRFFCYRIDLLAWLRRGRKPAAALEQNDSKDQSLWEWGSGIFRLVKLHTQWRVLEYELRAVNDVASIKVGDRSYPQFDIAVSGKKTLAYAIEKDNLWSSLMTLPSVLKLGSKEMNLKWEMDAVNISEGPAPLQVTSGLDFVSMLSRVGAASFFFLRVIFQTHFWSFAAAAYDKLQTQKEMDASPVTGRLAKPPERVAYGAVRSRTWSRKVEVFTNTDDDGITPLSRLIRYQPPHDGEGDKRKTLLLVHGLAHSSRVFWADTIETNFLQYFLEKNYDVWILDHRTSANYVPKVTPSHTWDDIALEDIPWSVKTVFDEVNRHSGRSKKKVHVFSHCIGAGATCISVLADKLKFENSDGERESMLGSLIPHAVTPWLYASAANRARENVWALFKDLGAIDVVEPCPHQDTPLLENIFDRIASSALDEEEKGQWCLFDRLFDKRGPDFIRTIYSRYTIFWGRQWWKPNINRATKKFFAGMIGATPAAVLQQVYFSITKGMLSNHEGENVYVTRENIDKHWDFPTLFFHGNRNTVFDMESSKLSANMLVRHRMRKSRGRALPPSISITPQDYVDNDVWIEVVPDYGHMDVIFSQSGAKDIFPRLDRFFSAVEDSTKTLADGYKRETNDGELIQKFERDCMSISHVGALRRVLTGPIISHPRIDGDICSVRIWSEAQDFTSMPADGLQTDITDATLTELPHQNANCYPGRDTLKDEFWLYDLEFKADREKEFRMWMEFGIDDTELNRDEAPKMASRMNWFSLPWYRRLISHKSAADNPFQLSFLAGSCLYPGSTFDAEQAVEVFQGMQKHVGLDEPSQTQIQGVDHILFLGDQIYADATADLFDPKAEYEKYRSSYRKAWSSRGARRLLRNVPSYFVVDDHEYDNDYAGYLALSEEEIEGLPLSESLQYEINLQQIDYARRMAWVFLKHDQAWDHDEVHLHQEFVSAGYPFFVFDTRFERKQLPRNDVEALVSAKQLAAFKQWLDSKEATESNTIFIVSGSPFGPVSKSEQREQSLLDGADNLLGYPGFLSAIVTYLAPLKHKNIVWLSGDPHLSCVSEITLNEGGAQASFLHVISSGLYAPITAINKNANSILWQGTVQLKWNEGQSLVFAAEQRLLTDHHQHFVRVDLAQAEQQTQLSLEAFDASGAAIKDSYYQCSMTSSREGAVDVDT